MGEAGGNAWCPVVSFDGAGYQHVSISVEGERSALVGVTPVVAITSNDKLSEGVNQHFVQCFEVFNARLWQVAVFPLHLLELIPTLVVGGLVQRFPLIPSLEATNIAILAGLAQWLFGLKRGSYDDFLTDLPHLVRVVKCAIALCHVNGGVA